MRDGSLTVFSDLVEGIYDCALDPSLWRDLLPRIAAYLDSDSSTFAVYDAANRHRFRFYDYGLTEEAVSSYFSTYAPLNPTLEAKSVFSVGEPYTLRMTISEEEYFESRFYKEWAKPNRQGDIIGVTALRQGTRMATHAVARLDHRDIFSQPDIEKYRLLVPHISRALTISDVLELKTVESESIAAVFDAMSAAVYLLDHDANVLHMNKAARDQLAHGNVLRLSAKKLQAKDPAADASFQATVAASQRRTPQSGSIALPGTTSTGSIATVLPVHQGRRRQATRSFGAATAVFVHDPELQIPFPGEALAQLYGLTAGELRVMLAAAPGLGSQEVADLLGISVTTVKTHLSRIFAKTGTNGQAGLVALMQRSSGPTAR